MENLVPALLDMLPSALDLMPSVQDVITSALGLILSVLYLIPAHVIAWGSVIFILASFLVYKMRHHGDSEPVSEMALLANELQETIRDFADFSARVDTMCTDVDRGDREAYKRICGIQMEYIQIQSRLANHDKVKQEMVKAYLQHCSKVKKQLQQVITQHSSQGSKPVAAPQRSRPRTAATEPTRSASNSSERRQATFRQSQSFGAASTSDSGNKHHKTAETVRSLAGNCSSSPSKEKMRPGISRKTNASDRRNASPEPRGSNRRIVTPPIVRSSRSTSSDKKPRDGSESSCGSRSSSRRERNITESKDNKGKDEKTCTIEDNINSLTKTFRSKSQCLKRSDGKGKTSVKKCEAVVGTERAPQLVVHGTRSTSLRRDYVLKSLESKKQIKLKQDGIRIGNECESENLTNTRKFESKKQEKLKQDASCVGDESILENITRPTSKRLESAGNKQDAQRVVKEKCLKRDTNAVSRPNCWNVIESIDEVTRMMEIIKTIDFKDSNESILNQVDSEDETTYSKRKNNAEGENCGNIESLLEEITNCQRSSEEQLEQINKTLLKDITNGQRMNKNLSEEITNCQRSSEVEEKEELAQNKQNIEERVADLELETIVEMKSDNPNQFISVTNQLEVQMFDKIEEEIYQDCNSSSVITQDSDTETFVSLQQNTDVYDDNILNLTTSASYSAVTVDDQTDDKIPNARIRKQRRKAVKKYGILKKHSNSLLRAKQESLRPTEAGVDEKLQVRCNCVVDLEQNNERISSYFEALSNVTTSASLILEEPSSCCCQTNKTAFGKTKKLSEETLSKASAGEMYANDGEFVQNESRPNLFFNLEGELSELDVSRVCVKKKSSQFALKYSKRGNGKSSGKLCVQKRDSISASQVGQTMSKIVGRLCVQMKVFKLPLEDEPELTEERESEDSLLEVESSPRYCAGDRPQSAGIVLDANQVGRLLSDSRVCCVDDSVLDMKTYGYNTSRTLSSGRLVPVDSRSLENFEEPTQTCNGSKQDYCLSLCDENAKITSCQITKVNLLSCIEGEPSANEDEGTFIVGESNCTESETSCVANASVESNDDNGDDTVVEDVDSFEECQSLPLTCETNTLTQSSDSLDTAVGEMTAQSCDSLDTAVGEKTSQSSVSLDAAVGKMTSEFSDLLEEAVREMTLDTAVGEMTAQSCDSLDTAVGEKTSQSSDSLDTAVGEMTAQSSDSLDTAVGEMTAQSSDSLDTAVGEKTSQSSVSLDAAVGKMTSEFSDLLEEAVREMTLDTAVGDMTAQSCDSLDTAVGEKTSQSSVSLDAAVGKMTSEFSDLLEEAVREMTSRSSDSLDTAVGEMTSQSSDSLGAAVGEMTSQVSVEVIVVSSCESFESCSTQDQDRLVSDYDCSQDCLDHTTVLHQAQIGSRNCQLLASRGKDNGLSFTLSDERNGERSCVRFNAAVASEFVRQLSVDCDLLSRLQAADEADIKKAGGSIKSFTINSGVHRYYVDLNENQRGRYLCLSYRQSTSPVLTQLAIPAKNMVDLRDHLDHMLDQYAA